MLTLSIAIPTAPYATLWLRTHLSITLGDQLHRPTQRRVLRDQIDRTLVSTVSAAGSRFADPPARLLSLELGRQTAET